MKRLDDLKRKSRVYAVIFGGRGCEHAVSCVSGANFISVAERCGFDILPIGIAPSGEWRIYLGEICRIKDGGWLKDIENLFPTFPLRYLGRSGFIAGTDIIEVISAVPVLHGDFGEDGTVQGALITAGIPLAGCDTVTGAVASDKAYTKSVAASLGIPTLPWLTYSQGECERDEIKRKAEEKIGYPMFIKPSRLGSSIGACPALCERDFYSSLEGALLCERRVIIERALLSKTELECAYFESGERKIITPPGQICVNDGFYDFKAKYQSDKARVCVRSDVPKGISDKLSEYTEALATELSVRQIARFDYFLSEEGEIFFNEVNTFPGMTEGSLYLSMLGACGVSAEEAVGSLLGGGGVW